MLLRSISCDCQSVSHTWLSVSCKQCFPFCLRLWLSWNERWLFILTGPERGGQFATAQATNSPDFLPPDKCAHFPFFICCRVLLSLTAHTIHCGRFLYFHYITQPSDLRGISTDIDNTIEVVHLVITLPALLCELNYIVCFSYFTAFPRTCPVVWAVVDT